ncbi:MAG TPA: LptE family protein [Bryobacteraceae bacterium]|jgi:outer membrane lipopolysaccharide assembly protein LptE/RlpB|nr:LptE family protein [Bryobacteraceae bacterium]
MSRLLLLAPVAFLFGCGYHVGGQADLMPRSIRTIAVPSFGNATTRYKLADRLPGAITREFLTRTRYQVVPRAEDADAVLRGAVVNYTSYPTVFDQVTGRAAGAQINVTLQVTLVERATGKVLFTRPSMDIRERYEISADQVAYFEESDIALDRLSQQVARSVVSAVVEMF